MNPETGVITVCGYFNRVVFAVMPHATIQLADK